MAIRNIRIIGDEILHKKSRRVDEINDRIHILLSDMADTLHSTSDGVGLAAPQVGVLRRVVVIDMGNGVINLINPEIVSTEGSVEGVESCLSVPAKTATVARPKKVTVKATNEKGEEFTVEGEGLLAVCLCHEIDHLDGILFVDKAIKETSEAKV
jgi:peptide deformylase